MPPRTAPYSTLRVFCPGLFLLLLLPVPSSGQDPDEESSIDVRGQVWVQGSAIDGPESWRRGGFGRLDFDRDAELARADLMLDWRPSTAIAENLAFFLHATARGEPDGIDGDEVGIIEAYVEASWSIGEANAIELGLGHFILPTSKSNTDLGWSSPYSLGFSAIDTWIGEEVRPTGLRASYRLATGDIDEIEIATTAFWNNDTAGTLLAWRGWAFSDRLTTFGEVLPLPALPELADSGGFAEQRDDGTLPFAEDLDGRVGVVGWLSYRRPERFSVQWTHYDNRGDRDIHDGEYAWRTRFDLLGADFHHGPWTLAAEWMEGSTGMGLTTGPNVETDFRSSYVLVSRYWEFLRATVRWEEFETRDRDGALALDPNEGDGHALTLALFWESYQYPLRIGLEWTEIDGTRPAAELAGFDADTGGESLKLELRWYFGS